MRCPSCGFENPAGVRFCGGCGTRLNHACPQCDAENPADFHFCGNCGTPLTASVSPRHALHIITPQSYTPRHLAEQILTSRPALEGECKLVETQMLAGARGAYRLMQDAQTMQVPGTVQAILAARIDRLPPEDKRLLQTAAVIGTEVSLPLLQAHCHLGLRTLYAKMGRAGSARAELSAAIELYHAMAMTFWLPQAEAALAAVEGR